MADLETTLREIWCGVLELPDVADEDDFFAVGGDSLSAVGIASRIREWLDIEVPLRELFEAATFAEFVERVRAAAPATRTDAAEAPPLRRLDRSRPLPASLTQERLFRLGDDPGQSAPMFIHVAFRIQGRLDRPRLAAALNVVGRRHEALRTAFQREGDVLQRIEPEPKLTIEQVRVDGTGEETCSRRPER